MPHYSDAAVAKMRAIVAVIDDESVHVQATPAWRAAWSQLLDVLALGPAPQTRECPKCHSTGMRAASRCGNCWASLEPLPPLAEGAPQ